VQYTLTDTAGAANITAREVLLSYNANDCAFL